MFKQRLLTTLVLIPLVLFAIYYADSWLFGLVIWLLVLAAGWEWLQLIPIFRVIYQLIFVLLLVGSIGLSVLWPNYWLLVGMPLWGFILLAVLMFPASQKVWGFPIIVGGACLLLIPLFASSLMGLYQHSRGKDLLLYLLCLVWAADIGAYLIGKCWGRCKLIPQVSPGKTLEGALGGLLLAMLVTLGGFFYFAPAFTGLWFVMAVCTVLISMLGDLFISMLKRRCHLKDTGHIFPGHGGVLDRLDSLIAAVPLFYYELRFIPLG